MTTTPPVEENRPPLLPIPPARKDEVVPPAPPTEDLHGDLAQVQVDQWGPVGEFVKGQIVRISQLKDNYDHQHAARVGVLRMLTKEEARDLPDAAIPPENSPSTNPPSTASVTPEPTAPKTPKS